MYQKMLYIPGMTSFALAIVTIFVRPELSSEDLKRISSEVKEVVLQAESRLRQGCMVRARLGSFFPPPHQNKQGGGDHVLSKMRLDQ